MIYADTAKAVEARRRAFLRKWRLRCPAVAASLEEAGDRLFAFLRLPPSQWKSARTTTAIERLHEEFKRRIKAQTVPPSAETAAMPFWAELPKVPRVQRVGWQRRSCWRQARSPCEGWACGRPLARDWPTPCRLTSPLGPSHHHPAGDTPSQAISTRYATLSHLSRQRHWMQDVRALLIAGYVAIVSALTLLMRWVSDDPE